MKPLVTGGAVFIGSNFIRYLLKTHPDSTVLNLDKLTYAGNLDNLSELESRATYRFIRGDVVDGLLSEGVDAVGHFVAESQVDRSIAAARDFVQTNVQGTFTLLDAARRRRVPRFLQGSTDEVYGSFAPGDKATEQAPLAPKPVRCQQVRGRPYHEEFLTYPAIVTRCSSNYSSLWSTGQATIAAMPSTVPRAPASLAGVRISVWRRG